jgi:hypothetical protein
MYETGLGAICITSFASYNNIPFHPSSPFSPQSPGSIDLIANNSQNKTRYLFKAVSAHTKKFICVLVRVNRPCTTIAGIFYFACVLLLGSSIHKRTRFPGEKLPDRIPYDYLKFYGPA